MFTDSLFLPHDSLSAKSVSYGIENAKDEFNEYPLWMPWMFAGLPSTHSMQNISEYYFPHHIISFIKLIGVPWFWNYLLHFLFCGLGMYLLLRKIKLEHVPSIFGSLSIVLFPWMIVNIAHGHGSQVMTAAYMPWILWSLLSLKEKPNIRDTAILALMIGLQLQRAHVQIAYYTWLMIAIYMIYDLISNYFLKEKINYKFFIYSGISSLLGLCMSFWIYIPLLNYTPLSKRSISMGDSAFNYATQWSLHPMESLTLMLPSSFGFGDLSYFGYMPMTNFPNYVGIVIVLLVFCAFYKNPNNRIKFYLLGISIFSLFVSFGNYFFLYDFLYKWLPYFSKFRVPSMILVVLNFSFILLAAIGFSNLLGKVKQRDSGIIILISIASLVILGLFFLRYSFLDFSVVNQSGLMTQDHPILNDFRVSMMKWDIVMFLFISITFIASAYLALKKIISIKVFVWIPIFLCFIDFYRIDYKIIHPNIEIGKTGYLNANPIIQDGSLLEKQFSPDDIIDFFKNDSSLYRVYPYNQSDNRLFAFNIESVGGYHPAKLSIYEYLDLYGAGIKTKDPKHYDTGIQARDGRNYINLNILKMLNVKYILSLQKINESQSVRHVKEGRFFYGSKYVNAHIYQIDNFEPRVQFLEKLDYRESREQGYLALRHPDFSIKENSFTSNDIFKSNPKISLNPSSEISIEHWSPNKLIIKTDIQGDNEERHFVLLSEVFFPLGWKMEGADDAEIIEVNNLLRGFLVSSGKSTITMEFKPLDIKYGAILTYFSTLVIIVLFLLSFIYKKDD